MLYLRNRKTTEYKAVEPDSVEFYELTGMRDPDDHRPIWEQTGAHDASEAQQRIDTGNIRPEDIGTDGQPVGDLTSAGAGRDDTFGPDRTEPTPGEIEQGAGRAADDADETFGQTGASSVAPERQAASTEGLESIHEGGSSSGSGGDGEPTVTELKAQAKEAGISGYSKMNRSELQDALAEHEGAAA